MNEKSIKATISLLIVLMAFAIFLLFYNYQQSVLSAENFYPFITLTFVGMGLLLGLLFLVNGSSAPVRAAKIAKSSKKSAKKKKK